EADAVIDQTLAGYREQGIRFRWTIGPDSAPADLGARLRDRGLEPEIVLGLACATDELGAELPSEVRSDVMVEPVDDANVVAFTEVMAQGWGMDPGPLLELHRRILATETERFPMHLARFHGQPAGAGVTALLPRSAFLMGAVVLPE